MFRQVAHRLLTRSTTTTYSIFPATTTLRPFSTEVSTDASSGDSAFIDAWKKVAPNIDPPKTPSQYMEPRPPTPSSLPSKLTVNFVLPYAAELSKAEGL
ncbi:putative ATP synthase, F1 complex, delta/epsilon subunit [Helianthus annuus]|nr:putative ATP synthase, F1 complex, delta/epsilon subunit [Helianthus annuus]KAJ0637369.1 putative ATP synthase, F1 complex, delta/epsilon subunit [Helianthus annuus]